MKSMAAHGCRTFPQGEAVSGRKEYFLPRLPGAGYSGGLTYRLAQYRTYLVYHEHDEPLGIDVPNA